MNVGIITPIKFLEQYCITDVQYCLPSLLCNSERYREFYIGRARKDNIVILDCRKTTWKREPADFRTVELALGLIKPNIIIAPSFMFNLEASLGIYEEFIKEFFASKTKIIRCLEGASKEDVEAFPKSRTIAVPSHMYRYLNNLKLSPHTIYIENHLNLEELEGRKGILVTSLPVKLGLQGRLMSNYRPSPNSLTFNEEEDNYPKIVMNNIEETISFYK